MSYEFMEVLENMDDLEWIEPEFRNIILNNYSLISLEIDAIFSILSYEIIKQFPIYKHEEYTKDVFVRLMGIVFDINHKIKLAHVFSEHSNDLSYKEHLYNYILFEVVTPREYIKLFDLHVKMFNKNKPMSIIERKMLLDKIENRVTDIFDIFCIAISYYKINELQKAEYNINKGLKKLNNLTDIIHIRHIVSKIEQYYYHDNQIQFHGGYSSSFFHEGLFKGSMLIDFHRKLYDALVFHKEFQTYASEREELLDKLIDYSEKK